MEKEQSFFKSESKEYPSGLQGLTAEVFSLIKDINSALTKKQPLDEKDLVRQRETGELAKAIIELYRAQNKNQGEIHQIGGAIFSNWQQGLDLLRQFRDEILGLVKIENFSIDEMKIDIPEERLRLFKNRIGILAERLGKKYGFQYLKYLNGLKKDYEIAIGSNDISGESKAWIGLKMLESQKDEDLKSFLEMMEKYG